MISPPTCPQTADVARHYDELDHWYREIWGEHVHHGLWLRGDERLEEAVEELVRAVARAAGIGRGSKVCDVGAGYGATSELLSRELGASVTGFTISRAQHERAALRASRDERLAFHLRDWLDNGLPGASFDAVVSIECVSHVEDKARFFREIRRVLRPGGRAAVCAWAAPEKPDPLRIRLLLEPICREGRLAGLATESEYRSWMVGAGLEDTAIEDLAPRVGKTWEVCARRVASRFLRDPELRRFALRSASRERVFALTVFRLLLASRTRSLRYLLMRGRAPLGRAGPSLSHPPEVHDARLS